jgi:hypothetical protein
MSSLGRARAAATSEAAGDALARLLQEAGRDPDLRARILFLVKLPASQRESLVNTAIEEMRLRGEPASARAAFAVLATDEGARLVAAELVRVSRG